MSVHEQFAEDLALHALGVLEGEERVALEKHLEGCAACRRELEQLRGDMALLALSTAGPTPPRRARQRLLEAVRREPRREHGRQRFWWRPVNVSMAGAAILLVALVLSWIRTDRLEREIAQLRGEATQQSAELQRAREVVSTLTATDAMRVTLVAAKTPPQPQGKAIYVRDRSSLIFLASNLQSLPAQKVYELWLIPTSGSPLPAGVFKPDAHGSATVINPPLPPGVQAKAFAITVEPEGGSSAPTLPIVMFGAGE
jgi:anti-sigma-K factor RskA